jgi:hypothetical protein
MFEKQVYPDQIFIDMVVEKIISNSIIKLTARNVSISNMAAIVESIIDSVVSLCCPSIISRQLTLPIELV